jgi:hypothetical protein
MGLDNASGCAHCCWRAAGASLPGQSLSLKEALPFKPVSSGQWASINQGPCYVKEKLMTSKHVSRVLILALGCVLCSPGEAKASSQIGASNGTIVGAIVGIVAGVAVIAIVAVRYSKKRTISGCVRSGQNGMIMNDEKDKLIYALSGDMADIKLGERVTLQGKKINPKRGESLRWEVTKIRTDYGVCQP